jgi:hypothetical protein
MKFLLAESVAPALLRKHAVSIDLCYCSLNGRCWELQSSSGRIAAEPKPIPQCTGTTAIESNPFLERK